MKKLYFFILSLCILTFWSCTDCPECPPEKTVVQRDTIEITEVRVDTMIVVDTLTITDTLTIEKSAEGKTQIPILSAAVNILYWKSGNILSMEVPGNLRNLTVTASDAEVIQSPADKRRITIVPDGRTCTLSGQAENDKGEVIKWNRRYRVIKPPKPTIQLLVNNTEYNGAMPINKRSNVVVRLRPDPDFLAALPRDARYTINKVELLSQRSLGAPTKVGIFSGSGKDAMKGIPIALGNKLMQDPPGTKIYFRILGVYRKNFKGEDVEEKFSERELYVGAVIR